MFLRLFQESGCRGSSEPTRSALRNTALGTVVGAVRLVDSARHPSRAHRPRHPNRTGGMSACTGLSRRKRPRPPSGNLRAQQSRFNRFRQEYNHDRPHEALDQKTPATPYLPSPRGSRQTAAHRISRPLRSPPRQSQQRHPLEKRWVCVTHTLASSTSDSRKSTIDYGRILPALKLGSMDEGASKSRHKGRFVRKTSVTHVPRLILLPISPAAHCALLRNP